MRASQQGSGRARIAVRRAFSPLRRPYLPEATRERGAGLVEVLVAFLVLSIIVVPMAYMLNTVLGQTATARNKIQALSIAEKWVEKLNSTGPPNTHTVPKVGISIPEGTTPAPTGVRRYTVSATVKYYPTAKFTWASPTGKPNLCTSKTVPQVLGLTVSVVYHGGSISDTTVIDYPPAGLPTFGFLGVQVEGSPTSPTDPTPPPARNGVKWGGIDGRVAGVPVTATSSTGTFHTTAGPVGCAFFELPVGTYMVKVGPHTLVTTFVTTGSTTTASKAITDATKVPVVVSKVSLAGPFQYDEGAWVDVAYPDSTVTDGSVTCPDVASFQCLVTGQGTVGGASASVNVLSGTTWSSEDLPLTTGIQKIESSACTTAVCVGVGFGTSGGAAVVDSPSHVGDWKASSPPVAFGVTMLRHVRCPTSTACLAVGTTSTGPVILGATVNTATTGAVSLTWSTDAVPAGLALTSITGFTCAGTTACFVTGTSTTSPVILAGGASGGAETWAKETLPLTMSKLTGIACAGTTACFAIGTSGGHPVVLAGAVSATTTTWVQENNISTTLKSISEIACDGTSACIVAGTTGTTSPAPPAVFAGAVSTSAESWTPDTLPPAMKSITQITCAGTACFAVGTDGSGDGIFAGPASPTPASWVQDTVPTALSIQKFICTGTDTCAATGTDTATQEAVILTGTDSSAAQTFTPATFPTAGAATLAGSVTRTGPTRTNHTITAADTSKPNLADVAGPAVDSHPRATRVDSAINHLTGVTINAQTVGFTLAASRHSITSVTPTSGTTAGGTTVTIHLTYVYLAPQPIIKFAGIAATTVRATTFKTVVTVKTPAHAAGKVKVSVTTYLTRYARTITFTGFTYVAPPPTITKVTPDDGPLTGRAGVVITGTHLTGATVTVGGNAATVTSTGATSITVTVPSGTAGVKTVTVTTVGGAATKATGFTYVPSPTITGFTPTSAGTAGGTTVTIIGTHLTGATTVKFGTTAAASYSVVSATEITAVTAAHAAGTVKISVTTAGGTVTDTTPFAFVVPTAAITTVTPSTGSINGGTSVTIAGRFLTGATAVKFGTTSAASFSVVSTDEIRAVTKAHAAGTVTVTVIAPDGTATKATAFTFVAPPPIVPVFISGVACYDNPTPTLVCVAAGATKDGAILLVGTKGSTGTFTWVSHSPAPVQGLVAPDLPVSVSNAALPSVSFVACTGTAAGLCTEPGPLYPYTDGYSVGAGSCSAELATSPAVATVPGTGPATFGPAVTLPLGMMSIRVVNASGQPVPGATVKAQVATTDLPLNAACNTLLGKPVSLTLGTTEADGTLAAATMYERYTLTVTSGSTTGTATIKVGPTEQTVTGTAYFLPSPAVVTL